MARKAGALALGAGLIALGVVALLDRSVEGFPSTWEMAPSIGAVYLAARILAEPRVRVRSWMLPGIAVLLLLQAAIVAELSIDGGLLWPLLIIAAGVALLVRALRRRKRDRNGGDAQATFGQVQRRVAGPLPDPLEIEATFGSCEFDLREAEVQAAPARINTNAVFGSIELRVPKNWNLDTSGVTATFGAVLDEDPPGAAEHAVQVTGSAVFGSIEIKR